MPFRGLSFQVPVRGSLSEYILPQWPSAFDQLGVSILASY
jgi:hypothetical protein